jgi:hypothetical protein
VSTQPKNAALQILTATLGELDASCIYYVSCLQCSTNRKIDPRGWLRVKGADFPIANLSRNYRCSECRSRKVAIVFERVKT